MRRGAFVATILASLMFASAASASPGVTLKASSQSVPLNTKVKVSATLLGRIPKNEKPAVIKIVASPGSSILCHRLPCSETVSKSSPQTVRFQSALFSKQGKRLAKSSIISVKWNAPPPPPPQPQTVSVSDGSGTATEDISSGKVTCSGAAVPDQSHCDVNESVGVNLSLRASTTATLAGTDDMWLGYSSGNALDPTYGNCVKSITSECVLALGNPDAVFSVSTPSSKTDFGGMHTLDLAGKLVSAAVGVLGEVHLNVLICEPGQDPVCG